MYQFIQEHRNLRKEPNTGYSKAFAIKDNRLNSSLQNKNSSFTQNTTGQFPVQRKFNTTTLIDNRETTNTENKINNAYLTNSTKTITAQRKTNSTTFTDNRTVGNDQSTVFELYNNTTIQRKENKTGLPEKLKSGIEFISNYSMDDVKVHYNSSKPAQLQAHAYAQGTDIHLAPGQEKHLPHEAWHVVQQKEGRVKPTKQLKSKVNINDDISLEKEADVMGAKAMQQIPAGNIPRKRKSAKNIFRSSTVKQEKKVIHSSDIVQRMFQPFDDNGYVPAANVPALNANQVNVAAENRLTHSPTQADVYITQTQDQTAPANPNRMDEIRNINFNNNGNPLSILNDPSINNPQALTRMHVINGKLRGPSQANNMVLGTAASNNFHPESHLRLVEQPIFNFLQANNPRRVGVRYTVTPDYNGPPHYLQQRAQHILNPPNPNDVLEWLTQACPTILQCNAVFYRMEQGQLQSKAQQENIQMDLGVPQPAQAPQQALPLIPLLPQPAQIAPALGAAALQPAQVFIAPPPQIGIVNRVAPPRFLRRYLARRFPIGRPARRLRPRLQNIPLDMLLELLVRRYFDQLARRGR
jgi:Domain of unknown function (DUF4157)